MPLIRLWDTKGLLRIVPGPLPPRALCRTFGAYNNETHWRQTRTQILGGPPLRASVPRFSSVLIGASTDRADFYHQACVTEARAASNCIAPALSLDDFAGLRALASLRSGVTLEPKPVPSGAAEPGCFYAAFGTLFQGDHGGVECATAGHQDLLREQGLLRDCDRLLGQHAVPNTSCYEALVIDDFFSVSVEPAAPYLSCPKSKLPQLLLQAESTQRVLRAPPVWVPSLGLV